MLWRLDVASKGHVSKSRSGDARPDVFDVFDVSKQRRETNKKSSALDKKRTDWAANRSRTPKKTKPHGLAVF